MDKTWEVLPRLASEVARWFPFRHLHLGCDELSKSAWKRSPAIAALKARHDLADNDDVQAHHIFHICKTYGIPLLIEVPEQLQGAAWGVLPNAPEVVEFLDPADTLGRALELLM